MQVDESCYPHLRTLLAVLADVDALLALAKIAKSPGYVQPEYDPDTKRIQVRAPWNDRDESKRRRLHIASPLFSRSSIFWVFFISFFLNFLR
jgi:hypothetical protein